jgi:hypothetical protein
MEALATRYRGEEADDPYPWVCLAASLLHPCMGVLTGLQLCTHLCVGEESNLDTLSVLCSCTLASLEGQQLQLLLLKP